MQEVSASHLIVRRVHAGTREEFGRPDSAIVERCGQEQVGTMIGGIRPLLQAAPFEPFTIVTSRGRRYPVPTADHAGLNPGASRVVGHEMSQTVRDEVTPQSHEWGYQPGSVETRKLIEGEARITLLPAGLSVRGELLEAQPRDSAALPWPGASLPSG